jgi:hypothetical protein
LDQHFNSCSLTRIYNLTGYLAIGQARMSQPVTTATSTAAEMANLSIFSLIHEIHATVTTSIDTSLSWDQLNSPPINYSLVRPIIERFTELSSTSDIEKDSKYDEANHRHLDVPVSDDGGESGQAVRVTARARVSLGAILYALMANRSVKTCTSQGPLAEPQDPIHHTRFW